MFVTTRRALDVSPWRELSAATDRLARMLDQPFSTLSDSNAFMPAIDVSETETELTIAAELPGVAKEDVKIDVEEGVLTIRGEKKQVHEEKKPHLHVYERSYGVFERAFSLPQSVDADRIKAEFQDGVLKLTLPKMEKEKGRRIEIKP